MLLAEAVPAQDDPIGRLLKEGLENVPGKDDGFRTGPGDVAPESGPKGAGKGGKKGPSCPDGWECVFAGRFVKGDYKNDSKTFNIASLTQNRGFDRISVRHQIGETHGLIVNTIKTGKNGKWKSYSQGLRLADGRTEFGVPVPQGTAELRLSVDHGRGARVRIVLERRLR